MKERPILFKGEMVKAILDGTKTQTRRVVKESVLARYNQIDAAHQGWDDFAAAWNAYARAPDDELTADAQVLKAKLLALCPYGKPGDHLWVRETWAETVYVDGDRAGEHEIVYRADAPDFQWVDGDGGVDYREDGCPRSSWRPSIHMPRKVSRITLEVTGVRVERVQEISIDDAIEEGTRCHLCSGPMDASVINQCPCIDREDSVRDSFHVLWDSINAKRGYGWDVNCWVWVVEFKRIRP
jgi:hypothetical protein